MGGRELKSAAERMAERRKILKTPVNMLPDDPENIRISKAEFLAKRRNAKEEAVAVEQFKKEFRAGKAEKLTHPAIKEEESGLQEKGKEEEVKTEKRGRPKKVE